MKLKSQMTADGSTTYFNEEFQEAYHSKHGAYTEALEKHVRACGIVELAIKQSELKILDFCFGLGYNSAVAIVEALKVNPEIRIEITALENDIEIIQEIAKLDFGSQLKIIQEDFAMLGHCERQRSNPVDQISTCTLSRQNYQIELLLGDARQAINKLKDDYYDAIFFDPFSPKVCPELWQPELIAQVVAKAKPGAYISTYSNSRVAKDGFNGAGCKIFEGPKCGRRNGGVLAQKTK